MWRWYCGSSGRKLKYSYNRISRTTDVTRTQVWSILHYKCLYLCHLGILPGVPANLMRIRELLLPRLHILHNIVFTDQQSRAVRWLLGENYEGRRIWRRGPVDWPARSPDLKPLDLSGCIKSRVYHNGKSKQCFNQAIDKALFLIKTNRDVRSGKIQRHNDWQNQCILMMGLLNKCYNNCCV